MKALLANAFAVGRLATVQEFYLSRSDMNVPIFNLINHLPMTKRAQPQLANRSIVQNLRARIRMVDNRLQMRHQH